MGYIKQLFENNIYCSALKELLTKKSNEKKSSNVRKTNGNLIDAHQISFNYWEKEVIRNIDFKLGKGEIVALIGENGSGKSTLAKILLGLLQPSSGSIKISSDKLSAVFQDFAKFKFSLRENVGFGELNHLHDDRRIFEKLLNVKAEFISYLQKSIDTELSKEFDS